MSARRLSLFRLLDSSFDRNSIGRGKAYFHAGHVSDASLETDENAGEITISARVSGSARRPYHVVLILSLEDDGPDLISCDCDCPLGGWCKHGVAALLAVAEDLSKTLESAAPHPPLPAPPPPFWPWEQWLARAAAPAPPPQMEEEWRLGFVFEAEPHPVLPRLLVRPIMLHRLKNGGWGRPEPLLRGMYTPQPLAGIERLDERQYALVAALRMQSSAYHTQGDACRFDGRNARSLLEALLSTQLCYWQKPRAGELSLGAELPLQWRWEFAADGQQRLHATGTVAPRQLLRATGKLWYFDPATRQLGPVDHDADLAERLLSAPPLPPEHAARVSEALRALPALAAVPPPRAIAARTIRATPTPVLTFARWPQDRQPRKRPGAVHARDIAPAFMARLSFDYEGHRLTADGPPIERHLEGDEPLLIERNDVEERRAADTLQRLQLLPAGTHQGLHWQLQSRALPGERLPRDCRHWHDPSDLLALHAPLSAAGFRIEVAPDFSVELLPEPQDWYGEVEDGHGNEWFDLELGIEVNGERVPLLPILQRALADLRFPLQPAADEPADAVWLAPLDEHRRVPLPLARVRALVQPLLEWLSPEKDSLRVPRLAADVLADLRQAGLPLHGSESADAFAQRLREAGRTRGVAPPAGLRAQPRGYQLDGLRWLDFLGEAGLGGMLADDMGLGKTLQVLMHLLAERQAGRLDAPVLVVCPTSVVGNWREQAARFAPDLRVLVLHGSDRAAQYERIGEHDLVVTTYALLPRDRDALCKQRFALAVFDEAQSIKNPLAKAAQVAREIPARRRLAVTGTPLENHLGELWAQIDCVLPGLLGSRDHFNRHYRTPIEKHGDLQRQARLNRRIAPFVLRRSKEDVAPELPPKTVIEHTVELGGRQRDLYETLRLAMHDKVKAALARRGLAQSNIIVLDALLKLRQACCDPRLVKLAGVAGAKAKKAESAKLEALLPMLVELIDEGRRILLFSQFTQMLDLIEAALRKDGIAHVRLDGSSRDRDTPIRCFQTGEVPLFLISLKAGGTGLNLTAADTVIHYDPWWNPAAEAQATDRAHRIGQDKPVFVYKLICAGTVEEKIQALQSRKADLARAVLEGGTRTGLLFDEDDISELFGAA